MPPARAAGDNPHGDHVGGDRSFVVGMSPFVTIIAIPGLAG